MQSASLPIHHEKTNGVGAVDLRHPNTHPTPLSKWHKRLPHLLLVASQRPSLRDKLLCMGKVVFVQMQDPGGHRDSEAGGDGVAFELGAAFRDYTREAGDDAEGEAEGFVYDASQIRKAFQNGELHLSVWIRECSLQFCREICVDLGVLDHLVYSRGQPIARCISCCR